MVPPAFTGYTPARTFNRAKRSCVSITKYQYVQHSSYLAYPGPLSQFWAPSHEPEETERRTTSSEFSSSRLMSRRSPLGHSYGGEASFACSILESHRQAVIASDPPFLHPATLHLQPRHPSRQVTPPPNPGERISSRIARPPASRRATSTISAPSCGASTGPPHRRAFSSRVHDSPLYGRSKNRKLTGGWLYPYVNARQAQCLPQNTNTFRPERQKP